MKTVNVPGKNKKHKIFLYTLSTCVWCKRTKKLLKDNDVEYAYTDVDLRDEKDQERIKNDIYRRAGRLSYPAIIIDDDTLIMGFREDEIRERLGT
jgi:glutaredoxin